MPSAYYQPIATIAILKGIGAAAPALLNVHVQSTGLNYKWASGSTLTADDQFIVTVTGISTGRYLAEQGAGTPRGIPDAVFSWFASLGFVIQAVYAVGNAIMNIGSYALAVARWNGFISGTTLFVNGVMGNDANPGTRALPVQTWTGLRTLNGSHINVAPGIYAPGDRRDTDTAPTNAWFYDAQGKVIVRVPGNDPTTASWTVASGTVYKMATSGNPVCRVLRTDQLDGEGEYQRIPKLADEAAVIASNYGWADDGTWLYLRIDGYSDINTFKANLDVLWGDAATARCLNSGTKVLYSNIDFYGVYTEALNDATTLAEQFIVGGSEKFSPDMGCFNQGCLSVYEKLFVYGALQDNFKYDPGVTGTNPPAYGVELFCSSSQAGDQETFGAGPGIQNASSMHATCKIVRVGGDYRNSAGPVVTDGGTPSDGTSSWCVAVNSHDSLLPAGATNAAFYWQGQNVWMDTCAGWGCTHAMVVDNSVLEYLNFSGAITLVSGGTATPYQPPLG